VSVGHGVLISGKVLPAAHIPTLPNIFPT